MRPDLQNVIVDDLPGIPIPRQAADNCADCCNRGNGRTDIPQSMTEPIGVDARFFRGARQVYRLSPAYRLS
jgi:hypothetical protein